MVWQKILLNPKTAGNVIKKIFKGDKQKTTGTEVITKIKPKPTKGESTKVWGQKLRANLNNATAYEGVEKVLKSTNRLLQKVKGEKVTKSGISKGKDLKD
mgnify:FL=1